MSDIPLHYQSLLTVADRLRQGDLTSVALTQHMLDRIVSLEPQLKSYATLMADQALAAARQADVEIAAGRYRSPLHGVPIAVKDLCYTRGVRTMGALKVLADFVPDFDATVVERLAAAGAILLGKLNLTEGAMAGYHPDFEIPRNPWDLSKWAGVSSSGCGVATAAGLAYATLGSDTGGSIRFPSAACGTVGLKPTWGRVSRYGVLNLAESLDHVGPMTRTVADAALVFQTIAGHDPHDPTSLTALVPDILTRLDGDIRGVRLGVDEAYIMSDSEPQVSRAVLAAIEVLAMLGAEIVPVQMPDVSEVSQAWVTLSTAEAVLAHEANYPSRRAEYGPYFLGLLDNGAKVTGAEYARAQKLRHAITGQIRAVFDQIDVLASPSSPLQPWLAPPEMLYGPGGKRNPARQKYAVPFDFNGAPTLSLRCGFAADGMPLSLQLAGPLLGEEMVCRVGYAYEQATEWHEQHPPLFP